MAVGENEYHFQDLRKILGLEHIYSQLGQTSKKCPNDAWKVWFHSHIALLFWSMGRLVWHLGGHVELELGRWNSASMANFSCWFQIWQPLSCRTKMKGGFWINIFWKWPACCMKRTFLWERILRRHILFPASFFMLNSKMITFLTSDQNPGSVWWPIKCIHF